ncbi:hypothetical protein BCR39DRAFT_516451 [Naematelia encephala]|uniref:Dol-P-Man:Man(5)GlcNAc(2)-PP-Dol alpha-1,3-mannosyltransferase n=1 Tax=Naematelia encephala TaxID=71784 RepID=A0A1Y2BJV9_9TREE|nr:hypothetical protein BCR39DRAFT_516451 [Naematelia encephala]
MSIKLSPALKSLISAPHAFPAALPAPPRQALNELFDQIRRRAEPYGVNADTWLTLGTAGIMTVNSPDSLCALWDFASARRDNQEGKIRDALIMRETGLKCISFNGIPRTINNLGALHTHQTKEFTDHLPTTSYRTPDASNLAEISTRGRALWNNIYSPHHEKLLSKLGQSHPDLPVHILNSHYGPLLSDPSTPGASIVGRLLTSIVAMTCLRLQTGVGLQVTSHVYGLKKALTEGNTAEKEVAGAEWLTSDEGVTWVLESADEISRVVAEGQTSFGKTLQKAKL